MSVLEGRFEGLRRHFTVLREAWRLERRADKSRRPRAEHEFLPAALEIIEKPPSPGLRLLLLTMCSLFAIAVLWSVLGRIDVMAVASGRTEPAGNVKIV